MPVSEDPIRVLVVDDTVTYRKIVSDLLEDEADIEVIGVAANGRIAMQKIEHGRPDLITLDLEMPELDGLGVLRELRGMTNPPGAIMLSAFTSQGASQTLAALSEGAFDFVLKPDEGDIETNKARLRQALCPKIRTYMSTRRVKHRAPALLSSKVASAIEKPRPIETSIPARRISGIGGRPRVVALGISTGGPRALSTMMPKLPGDLDVGMVIVQHMPPLFTKSLADDLNRRCALTVSEARDGQPVLKGHALIAPGGRQMKVVAQGPDLLVSLTDDPPENSCRPSVDYLFRSVANTCGAESVGVIMTGMGNDGSLGCRLMKRRGATIIAQDEASCVVFGMPKEPIEEGIVDVVAPLEGIATEITRLAGKGLVTCR
mgnify:CR=1 FL=1